MSKPNSTVIRVRAAMWAALGTTCMASAANADEGYRTNTPIKHLVAIFQENVSFDHYFGTYPHAMLSIAHIFELSAPPPHSSPES
jgi:phospholipase C